jgi:hypothetical protein
MKQKQKRNPILGYTRLIAKVTGLVATLTAIFIFMLQYLPTYLKIGRGWLIGFIIVSILWAWDILWSTLKDLKELGEEIDKNRQTDSN